MKEIMGIFNSIKETSGSNGKQEILTKHKDNKEFLDLVYFLYNPYIITGIGKKKMDKQKDSYYTEAEEFGSIDEMLKFVVENSNNVSDKVVSKVANYINQQSEDLRDFLRQVVTKEYKCGITASTINKVYGKGFIPKHDVMLAKSWDDEHKKVTGKFIITPKLDGLRCTVFKENGEVKFFTRKGLPIIGMEDLEKEFDELPDNMVYDGELLLTNEKGLDRLKLFRETQKVVKKDGVKKGLEYYMYDMLPISEFREGRSNLGAYYRKVGLERLVYSKEFVLIKAVPMYYVGGDKDKVVEILKEELDKGLEGIIINTLDGKYECKRTSNLLKAKKIEEKTIDLRVTDFFEGEGEDKGMLGGFIVDYRGYPLRVASGLKRHEQIEYWKNPKELIGMIIEVKYDDETQNQNGGESLRFPIFRGIRYDKDEVSYHA